MELIEKIKYREDNDKSDLRLKAIVFLIILIPILLLLFKSSAIRILSLVIPGGIIFFLSRPEGTIEIYGDGEKLFLKHIVKNKDESELLPITSSEFTWSYNYLVSGTKGNAGNRKTATVNFDLLTLEIKTKAGGRFMICKELNQWQSLPSDWEYKIIPAENKVPLFVTSSNLNQLKKKIEKLT